MRVFLAILIVLLVRWPAIGQGLQPDLAALKVRPELSPQLTSDEVNKALSEWPSRLDAASKAWPKGDATLDQSRAELASQFAGATKIILYSLYPAPVENFRDTPLSKEDKRLLKLPRFHDYPVFGSVGISDANAVERWSRYFQTQVVPAKIFMCDFRPRHGFRILTPNGEIDFLVCFHCSQIQAFGAPKIKLSGFWTPMMSPAARDAVDAVLRKNHIELDKGN